MTEPQTPTGKRLMEFPDGLATANERRKVAIAIEREAAAAELRDPEATDDVSISMYDKWRKARADADRLAEALREYHDGDSEGCTADCPAEEALRLHDEATDD